MFAEGTENDKPRARPLALHPVAGAWLPGGAGPALPGGHPAAPDPEERVGRGGFLAPPAPVHVRAALAQLAQQMAPLIVQLAAGRAQPQAAARRTDLAAVDRVTARLRL